MGKDVSSLGAGLPYPQSSGISNSDSYLDHPSNKFVQAFLEGQEQLFHRGRLGSLWRLAEFWKDKIIPLREAINEFVDPIISEAIERKREEKNIEAKVDLGEQNLLSYLVEQTQGLSLIRLADVSS